MISLDICLNGARSYVQGTQLIARSAEALAEARPGAAITLRSAAFHRMTDRHVDLSIGAEAEQVGDPIGVLNFGSNDAPEVAYLYEPGATAPRRDIAVAAAWDKCAADHDGVLSAGFELSGLHTGEDLLVAIVQTVKGLHEALAEDVKDVWLTGFRSANIPMAGPFPDPEGVLQLQSRRVMKSDGVWQTLQMASFVGRQGGDPIRAAVTFSFKSKALTHVD